MVTEYPHGAEPAMGRVLQNAAQLLELWRASIGDEVSGESHEVRRELLNSAERFDDVVVVNPGAYVNIANLRESATF